MYEPRGAGNARKNVGGKGNTTTIRAEAVQGIYSYIAERGSWRGKLDSLRRRVIAHVGHDPGFPPAAGDPLCKTFEKVLKDVLDLFQSIGIDHQWERERGEVATLTLTVTRQDPNAALVLGLTGSSAGAAPSIEDYERELCQGSSSAILRDAAAHLWRLGQAARTSPKLVVPWFQAAKYAVEVREDLAVRSLIDSGQGDRLAALREPATPFPLPTPPDED